MKILVFENNDIHADALASLQSAGQEICFANDYSGDYASVRAVFVRTYTQVNQDFLEQFPNLQYVIKAGVGLDNVDVELCKSKGIQVFNSPGANAHSVAELAVGFTIFLLRNVYAQIESLKNNAWRQRQYLGSELTGKTLGILGCGAVGKLIAHKIKGFDIQNILGYDPYLSTEQLAEVGITKAELTEVMEQADAVILCIPLTPTTYNLITLQELQLMKPTSHIINVSRGGIINENDLCYALNNGVIAGAALDVFEKEPYDINPTLLNCKNLIATPHIGGYTVEGDRAICVTAAQNFLNSIR